MFIARVCRYASLFSRVIAWANHWLWAIATFAVPRCWFTTLPRRSKEAMAKCFLRFQITRASHVPLCGNRCVHSANWENSPQLGWSLREKPRGPHKCSANPFPQKVSPVSLCFVGLGGCEFVFVSVACGRKQNDIWSRGPHPMLLAKAIPSCT